MKTIYLIIALSSCLLLVGCGGASQAVQAEKNSPTKPAPLQLEQNVSIQKVHEIKKREDVVLIDVREQGEYDAAHIPGVVLIPKGSVTDRLAEIPKDKTVIFTCRSGNRSGQVTELLREKGYDNVHNMTGGIKAWSKAGYSVEK